MPLLEPPPLWGTAIYVYASAACCVRGASWMDRGVSSSFCSVGLRASESPRAAAARCFLQDVHICPPRKGVQVMMVFGHS